jgi:hypothetical protein
VTRLTLKVATYVNCEAWNCVAISGSSHANGVYGLGRLDGAGVDAEDMPGTGERQAGVKRGEAYFSCLSAQVPWLDCIRMRYRCCISQLASMRCSEDRVQVRWDETRRCLVPSEA